MKSYRMYYWKQILEEEGLPQSHLFTSEKKPSRCEDYVREKVFAIDFDEKAVRVGRTLNLIAGDGQTNVLHLNTLDFERWNERTDDDKDWIDTYFEGWKRFKKFRVEKDGNHRFQFDVLMANPPFKLEAEAKQYIQEKIKSGEIELIWSYVLDYENNSNPSLDKKNPFNHGKN